MRSPPIMTFLPRLVVVAAFLCGLVSCVAPQNKMPSGLGAHLSGRSIACVRQATGPFGCVTPSQALAGGALALHGNVASMNAMIAAGGRNANVPSQDPGVQIERALMQHFATRFSMKPGASLLVPQQGPYGNRGPRLATGCDYVLEVGPVNWGASYFPTAWLRYRVGVHAQAQLIDGKTGKVLAKGTFGALPTERSEGLGHSDIMANTNGVVTRDVNEACRQINAHFTQQVFVP